MERKGGWGSRACAQQGGVGCSRCLWALWKILGINGAGVGFGCLPVCPTLLRQFLAMQTLLIAASWHHHLVCVFARRWMRGALP